MKRIAGIAGGMFLVLGLLVPIAIAAEDTLPHTGRVIVSVKGDATLPAGEHADVVVVVQGTATINGEANVVVVVDGTANLQGARVNTVVAVRSPVTLGPGTVVLGDVRTLNSTVTQDPTATVNGSTRDMTTDFAALGFALVTGFLLLFVGFAIAVILGALLVAALAARQVRAAETLISREPAKSFVTGLVAVFVIPIVAVLAFLTVVGVPLGLAILLGLWPLAGFVGYVVTGIWIGDWLLHRSVGDPGKTTVRRGRGRRAHPGHPERDPDPGNHHRHCEPVRFRGSPAAGLADAAWHDCDRSACAGHPPAAGSDPRRAGVTDPQPRLNDSRGPTRAVAPARNRSNRGSGSGAGRSR